MRTLALIACLAACDAGEKPAPSQPAKPPGPKVVVQSSVPDLEYLPAEADFVIAVDVAKLRSSKLWATYAKDVRRIVAPGATDCSYDPLASARSIVVATTAEPSSYTIVVRGVDRDKALACPGLVTGELHFINDALVRVHGRALPHAKNLVDDTAFVTEYTAALKQMKPGAALTLVTRTNSKAVSQQWDAMGTKLEKLYGSATISDRVDVRVSVVLATLSQATNLASVLQSQRQSAGIKAMFDRFDVVAQGSTMNVDVGMTEKQIESIAGMLLIAAPTN